MNYQQIVTESFSTPAVMSALQYFYDLTVDGFDSKQSRRDAMIMFVSQFLSKILNNFFVTKLVGKVTNFYTVNLAAKLTEPVLNYFIYNQLFDMWFVKKVGAYPSRNTYEQLIPILSVLIGQFLETYLLAWLTGRRSFVDQYDL